MLVRVSHISEIAVTCKSSNGLTNRFFSPKNWDPYLNFEYKTISGGGDICKTKWNSWLDDSDQNWNYLI